MITRLYDSRIRAAVEDHISDPRFDWRLWKCQLFAESTMDPTAVSPVGARGLAQFMPGTWEEWAPRAGYPDAAPEDTRAAIATGAMYMDWLIREWSAPRLPIDRFCLAMASYNAGLRWLLAAQELTVNDQSAAANDYKTISQWLPAVTGEHARETRTYVRRILNYYAQEITGCSA